MKPMRPPIVCFHGSPGTPDDFLELERHLPDARLVRLARKGYPTDGYSAHPPQQGHYSEESVFLGYSWGALASLREAVTFLEYVSAIVLIAPYIYPETTSRLNKALVAASFIGRTLLARKGASIVEELLRKTAYPCEVPSTYRRLAKTLARPKVLSRAVLEKDEKGISADEALEIVRATGIPLAVIRGAEDQTSREAQQILPIHKWAPHAVETQLDHAGHALLWTHPTEVARAIRSFLKAT